MSLIHVKASGQSDDTLSAERACDELACMADDSRSRKSWYVLERNPNSILNVISQAAKTRAEHNSNDGFLISGAGTNRIRALTRSIPSEWRAHAASALKADISDE